MATKKIIKKDKVQPEQQSAMKIKPNPNPKPNEEKEEKEEKEEQGEKEEKVYNADVKEKNQDFDAYEFYKTYDPTKNKFNNVLSLYEFTSCLGLRATQISEGCPVLIDVPEGMENPEEIALLEIKAGKCPLIICREGREYWRVCDLINPHID
jgi:DNA-directed RNA polymerase subunit K/omega